MLWAGIRSIFGRADTRKSIQRRGGAPPPSAWQTGVNKVRMEGTMKTSSRLLPLCAFAGGLLLMAGVARAQLLITGNDEKVWFDEAGKTVNQPPGKDTVSIIDIREPTKPSILASLPLMNTIIGPPVNLAI